MMIIHAEGLFHHLEQRSFFLTLFLLIIKLLNFRIKHFPIYTTCVLAIIKGSKQLFGDNQKDANLLGISTKFGQFTKIVYRQENIRFKQKDVASKNIEDVWRVIKS
jgi:hypothetical protein